MYELHKLTLAEPVSFFPYILEEQRSIVSHWHENIEILHVIRGTLRAFLDSEEHVCGVRGTLVINPNTVHRLTPEGGDAEYLCLIVSAEFLLQMGLDPIKTKIVPALYEKDITLLFEEIYRLAAEKTPYHECEMTADALKLVTVLFRDHARAAGDKHRTSAGTDAVKKALGFIKEHFAENVTLSRVADAVGVSKHYLCHRFKEITGMTLTDMLNHVRCHEARVRLLSSDFTVQQTAYRCGFTNMSYFTRTYKAIMGHLPSSVKGKKR